MLGRWLRRVGFYCGIVFLALFAIIPVLWGLITVFKTNNDLYTAGKMPFLFNEPPTLEHLVYLFTQTNFGTFLWNSVLIGVFVVLITLLLSVPAAFSLARFTGKWGEHSGMAIFLVYLIPPSLLFIPMYKIVVWLGLADSILSLIFVLPTITVPFCTWLLLGFFRACHAVWMRPRSSMAAVISRRFARSCCRRSNPAWERARCLPSRFRWATTSTRSLSSPSHPRATSVLACPPN